MVMHAMMNHEEHQHASGSMQAPGYAGAPAASGAKCSHCGFPLGQGFSFCPNCGMSLKSADCPACGQKVDPAWNACAYCGSPLGAVQK
jgi:membrane protease subunit (stomatin/prohibitin family)